MLRLLLVPLLASQLLFSQAVHKTFSSRGRTIRYTVTAFTPPVQITQDGGLNQETTINCVRLYWSRLKDLDINGAAQLYLDPQREIDLRTKYRQRVGDEVFRRMHSEVFESTRFTHELVIGNEHALVPEKNPGTLLLFRLRNGKFFLEQPDIEKIDAGGVNQDGLDLIDIVNARADGKLTF